MFENFENLHFFTLLHMPKVTQLLTMSRVLIISAHTVDES